MKKIIAFVLLALGLGGYIYFFDNSSLDLAKQDAEQNQLLYDTFQEKHVHHIIIKNGDETIDMTRPWLGEWTLNNVNAPADRETINQMLEIILSLNKNQLVSDNPKNWTKFEVAQGEGIEVILKERDDREVAHFWVGKTGPSYGTQYFRKNNLNEVYLVNANLSTQFSRPLDAWRDKTILKVEQDKITGVEVNNNYNLVRVGSGWTLDNVEIPQEKVDVVLSAVSDLKTTEFPIDAIELNAETADYVVNIQTEMETKTLYLKKVEDSEDYFVMLEGNPTLFKITEIKADEFLKVNATEETVTE